MFSTLKCEAKNRKKSEEISCTQGNKKCPVTQYLFIPVYTGTCKVSPEEQAASDAQFERLTSLQWEQQLVEIIGSIIPGVGKCSWSSSWRFLLGEF